MNWKFFFAKTLGIAALLGSSLVGSAKGADLRGTVPFDFEAAGQKFSAGTYIVSTLGFNQVLTIRDSQFRQRYIQYTSHELVSRAASPQLVFVRTADGIVLTDVKGIPGVGDRKVLVKKKPQGQRVQIALLR